MGLKKLRGQRLHITEDRQDKLERLFSAAFAKEMGKTNLTLKATKSNIEILVV